MFHGEHEAKKLGKSGDDKSTFRASNFTRNRLPKAIGAILHHLR